ncbi:prefoldin subunit 1 [Manduca sexta]|uniref:Prefoldin subunit 1 n=1 Tax=Manduca sexta TaxID=7130 RepID=A0A921Z8K2_MANSE|nr:prefoldin subunit 1 [Manduca sexta]KAG6452484.1 hypothetical protein O3G_MSEX007662 [Manduca sexta]
MAKGVPVDLELKRAFGELHEKMIETTKKIHSLDTQIVVFKRQLEIAELSEHEICNLPRGVKIYEGVARMFLLTEPHDIVRDIKCRQFKLNDRITEFTNHKKFLEMNLRDSTNNLREMVQHRKELSEFEAQGHKAN